MTRAALPTLLATILVLVPGCSERASPARPHGVVLFLLDTVRPDRMSCYGHERATTPHIDALAERGARFEQAVSFSPWTLPSVAAMLAGEPANAAFQGTLQRSLVQEFQRAGVRTAAVTENGYLSAKYGFDLGFDDYVEEAPVRPDDPLAKGAIGRTFAAAEAWLREHQRTRPTEPFFLLVHTYEAHAPYTRTTFADGMPTGRVGDVFRIEALDGLRRGAVEFDDADLERLAALYDGGIHEADRHVGRFLSRLDEEGIADRVVVAVTSDHGEDLGEHYRRRAGDHGHSLLDDLMLVPLVIADPTRRFAERVVPTQVRTLDLLPTLADLLGVDVGRATEGRSLLPLLEGTPEPPRVAFGGSMHSGPDCVFVRHLGYKFIEQLGPDTHDPPLVPAPPRVQLYDLRNDPAESVNLADSRSDLVERFRDLNRRIDARGSATVTIDTADPEFAKRLEQLGYTTK